jgi:ATP-dependent DNA ligase
MPLSKILTTGSFRRAPRRAPQSRLAEPDWVDEIKYDGYRLQIRPMVTRSGVSPGAASGRYPVIVRTAAELRARSFTIDGEASCLIANNIVFRQGICARFAPPNGRSLSS